MTTQTFAHYTSKEDKYSLPLTSSNNFYIYMLFRIYTNILIKVSTNIDIEKLSNKILHVYKHDVSLGMPLVQLIQFQPFYKPKWFNHFPTWKFELKRKEETGQLIGFSLV